MNVKLSAVLLCAALVPTVQTRAKTVLPDACGKDEIQFKVKVAHLPDGESYSAPAPPEAGKAQIVFIEVLDTSGMIFTTPTTRFGVDGEWVGADKGLSRFSIDVSPGVHHVCVNWQSENWDEARNVGMDTFTAEAGKVYYYEVKISRKQAVLAGAESNVMPLTNVSFTFSQVSEDEGSYRVKASPPSTFKSHVEEPQQP